VQLNLTQRPTDQSAFRSIDWLTLFLYIVMLAAGVGSIYAASYDFDHANVLSFDEFSGKQIRWIALALLLGLVIIGNRL